MDINAIAEGSTTAAPGIVIVTTPTATGSNPAPATAAGDAFRTTVADVFAS